MMLLIEIPDLPLSINAAFATFKGRRITTRAYKEWLCLVERCIPDGIPDFAGSLLSVEIDLLAPNWMTQKGEPRKVDADNYAKTCIDSIFMHLPVDDSRIFTLKVSKVSGPVPKTIVRIFDLKVS